MMDCGYEPPKWAGKAPAGYHLEVSKDGKLFQKLPIDEKTYYTFGRNMHLTDFCIDHASCSRLHAVLVYHKHLDRFFLTDLGSTHGSHIGNVRLEANKPTQLPLDSVFHFGASTRMYTLRHKVGKDGATALELEDANGNLPETEYEVDNLTEYNTSQNRRISMLGISTDDEGNLLKPATAMKRKCVTFIEEEDVINPEDVDPTVGRFRNLVQTTIVANNMPRKRQRVDEPSSSSALSRSSLSFLPKINPAPSMGPPATPTPTSPPAATSSYSSSFLTAKSLGILPSPAPDPSLPLEVIHQQTGSREADDPEMEPSGASLYDEFMSPPGGGGAEDPSKKKYAKEAWPGPHAPPLANF